MDLIPHYFLFPHSPYSELLEKKLVGVFMNRQILGWDPRHSFNGKLWKRVEGSSAYKWVGEHLNKTCIERNLTVRLVTLFVIRSVLNGICRLYPRNTACSWLSRRAWRTAKTHRTFCDAESSFPAEVGTGAETASLGLAWYQAFL